MTATIPVGTLVLLTTGAYSDFEVGALLRVRRPIDADVWAQLGAACTGKDDPKYPNFFDHSLAVPWLLAQGYAEEVAMTELHTDSYGEQTPWEDA